MAPAAPYPSAFLIGDHVLLRESLATALHDQYDLEIVGQASFEAALEVTPAELELAHVVLIDVDVSGVPCLECIRKVLGDHAPPAVLLSAVRRDHYLMEIEKGGCASGYIAKTVPLDTLVDALRQVASGGIVIRGLDDPVSSSAPEGELHAIRQLSGRELEILHLVATGSSRKRIAEHMGISLKTVETLTERLMMKVDLHDRVQLTRLAVRAGIVQP